MPRRILEELSWDECFTLLRQQVIGRLVYQDELGPAAVPVNYAVAGNTIVFRSEAGSKVRGLHERDIAFQVDHIDTVSHSGWSVLIRGAAEEVEFERLSELIRQIDDVVPQPWKKGIHNIWVVITPKVVSGRRLAEVASEDFWLF
jgi:nitroimidazol reductase NimA-like FMN-containing flavoprotein (pyridoxamine 5'-phosphate oxidase superfamily)